VELEKKIFGLIGYPLGHSWSAAYFNEKFRREGHVHKSYQLFPLASLDRFPALISNVPELTGLNVTIPYKECIIPYLDDIDETAHRIGAVNTIKITREKGRIHTMGFNTDSAGFFLTLTDHIKQSNALILGTGGASKAVAFALQNLQIRYTFISRKPNAAGILSYNELTVEMIKDNKLIINTTPVGMFPDVGACPPIPYDAIGEDHLLYDLIYNPEETVFLRRGKIRNAHTINGLQMLINQADLAYEIFTSTEDITPWFPVRYPLQPQSSD
jgi:shikimate dehydrogenase